MTATLDGLARQNEALAEKYDVAQSQVEAQQAAASLAKQSAAKSAAEFQTVRERLVTTLWARYEASSYSTTGALLTSKNGQDYLDQLSTLRLLSVHTADLLAQVDAAKSRAAAAAQTGASLLAEATATSDGLAAQQSRIVADTATFRNVLATLTAAQQAVYRTRNAVVAPALAATITAGLATIKPLPAISRPRPPTGTRWPPTVAVRPASGAAQRAVAFALKQVGRAYRYTGTGPSAFDCSGLTMTAWGHAGIALPHSSEAQYSRGIHIAESDLRPGDLIFLYRPISHVEIYIGSGLAVSAADPALGVVVVNISRDQRDYVGATRLS